MKGLESLGRIQHDSSFPIQKVGLRLWLCDKMSALNVLDVYGGYGLMYRQVWEKRATTYTATEGDALGWLGTHSLDYDIYDVDPWGSPWEVLDIINQKSIKETIGIACTDGAVKKEGQIRGTIPKIVTEKLAWDSKDKRLLAEIFYHYPVACRQILRVIMINYKITSLAVKEHGGAGVGTAYFAAILEKR